jgi:Na+/H+-dicarboxylate symporter
MPMSGRITMPVVLTQLMCWYQFFSVIGCVLMCGLRRALLMFDTCSLAPGTGAFTAIVCCAEIEESQNLLRKPIIPSPFKG